MELKVNAHNPVNPRHFQPIIEPVLDEVYNEDRKPDNNKNQEHEVIDTAPKLVCVLY